MSWLVFAFSGPVLWAISTHLDKYLVERFFKDANAAVLLVFTALAGLALLPFIFVGVPAVIALEARAIALMGLAGILYMTAMLLYLRALQRAEASVVAPFFQASPLIGYALAYLVLGETLTATQLAGGALIVTGTLIVSLRVGGGPGGGGGAVGRGRFNLRLATLMLGCASMLAVSALIFKVFALKDEFWSTTFWMFVGQAIFGAALLAYAPYRAEFLRALRSNTGALLALNGANELINIGGSLGTRYALLLAPLSLVQAVGSTTTLFVFGFGVLISLFWPALGRERLTAADLVQKGAAAGLVAAGVILVGG
jgi:drug/metabolite transporter (DMT)-like permease